MRGGMVTEWADALHVSPKELPDELRRLYRESVTLHEELIHFRQKVHQRPLEHISAALGVAENALSQASEGLSFALSEASREVY